jgi:hypothetical protein
VSTHVCTNSRRRIFLLLFMLMFIDACHCSQHHTKFYSTFLSLFFLHMQVELLGINSVDFDVLIDQ